MPLHSSLQEVGDRVADWSRAGGDAPFLLYVYSPKEEFVIRREFGELKLWLEANGVKCFSVSLADLFWQAIDEAGWSESLVKAERDAIGDERTLADVYEYVGEVLRQSPTLPERVVQAIEGSDEHSAAFLYRAGALFPAFRTSALLDDLRTMIHIPVTLLYPGRLVGSHGLRFMDRWEPAYGYRATIIERGGNS